MVISRPADAGTDLEGEFSNANLAPITLETPVMVKDTDAGLFRSRLTAEAIQAIITSGQVSIPVDPATWTKSINPLFIVVAEATYP